MLFWLCLKWVMQEMVAVWDDTMELFGSILAAVCLRV
jgi:hypothetical protein